MHRRDVTFGLAALGSGLAAPALANKDDDGPALLSPYGRISLRTATRQVLLNTLIIATSTQALGFDLRAEFPQFNENRANLGRLLGGLTRPTLSDRLATMALVGHLVLLKSALYILPGEEDFVTPALVTIANQNLSWDVKKKPRSVSLSRIPALSDLFARKAVGNAYGNRKELILMVRPTITREPDA
jgi:hypothetical protein